jgi:hypothetical protein
MKKLLFILLTVSLGYSQGFHAYVLEYGTVDTITQLMNPDTTIQMDDVFVEMNEGGLTIYTEKMQEYVFFSNKEVYSSDTLFVCTSMVKDQDEDTGMLTYCYSKYSNRRTILIRYRNMYLKYWVRS